MREIRLTKGYTALVDDEDFEELNKFKWSALCRLTGKQRVKNLYVRAYRKEKGTNRNVYMSRQIMGDVGLKHVIHWNGDALDCTRANLIVCAKEEATEYRERATHSMHDPSRWCFTHQCWLRASQIPLDDHERNPSFVNNCNSIAKNTDLLPKKKAIGIRT